MDFFPNKPDGLPDKYDLNVHKIRRPEPLKNEEQKDGGGKKKKRRRADEHGEAKDHFAELSKAAELAHEILVKKNSPYRFCIYKENDEIFIDIVILDLNGKIASVKKKNITHDEFYKWMDHIEEQEGLFFDENG